MKFILGKRIDASLLASELETALEIKLTGSRQVGFLNTASNEIEIILKDREITNSETEVIIQIIASHNADKLAYIEKRAREYPPATDYLDGIVKGDQAQVQKYIDDCLAVKAKYPKK